MVAEHFLNNRWGLSLKLSIALQVDNGNPGDSVAAYSCKGIISSSGEGAIFDTWALKEAEPFNYDGFVFPEYDLSVITCTPWIWHDADNSAKYAILRDYVSTINTRKLIAFGVGSAYNLDHNNNQERYAGEIETRSTLDVWGKVDKVVCRDRLAYLIYSEMLGSDKVELLPCPSFYSSQVFGVQPDPVHERLLVFCNITPETQWGMQPGDVQIAMDLQDKLVSSGVPTMTMTDGDYDSFVQRYGKKPAHDLRSPKRIIETIARYHSLISARVHACMPALSLGMDVDIIPLDSRSLTAIQVGANAVAIDMKVMGRYKEEIPKLSLSAMRARTAELLGL